MTFSITAKKVFKYVGKLITPACFTLPLHQFFFQSDFKQCMIIKTSKIIAQALWLHAHVINSKLNEIEQISWNSNGANPVKTNKKKTAHSGVLINWTSNLISA